MTDAFDDWYATQQYELIRECKRIRDEEDREGLYERYLNGLTVDSDNEWEYD